MKQNMQTSVLLQATNLELRVQTEAAISLEYICPACLFWSQPSDFFVSSMCSDNSDCETFLALKKVPFCTLVEKQKKLYII